MLYSLSLHYSSSVSDYLFSKLSKYKLLSF